MEALMHVWTEIGKTDLGTVISTCAKCDWTRVLDPDKGTVVYSGDKTIKLESETDPKGLLCPPETDV